MAVSGTLHKIVWGGTLCDTESWACSLHYLTQEPTLLDLEAIKAAAKTFLQDGATGFNKSATMTFIKANPLNPATGNYSLATESHELNFAPLSPSSGSVLGPPQLSVVVSLETARARGLASKGRFFPPWAGTVGQNGKIAGPDTSSAQYAIAQGAIVMIRALDAMGPIPGQVVVFSLKGQIAEPVTGVRVGNVVDTQRRRRASLIEDYFHVAI